MRHQIRRPSQKERLKGSGSVRRHRHPHKQRLSCELDEHHLARNEAVRPNA